MSLFSDTVTNDVDINTAFETLVGEGKRYASPQELAKAKIHADSHIQRLEAELAELRQKAEKSTTLEEVRSTILSELKKEPQTQPDTPPEKVETPNIEDLIEQKLTTREAQRRAEANLTTVTEVMTKKFGQDAQLFLAEKAKELNVSLAYLQETAKNSPQAFFRLLGVDQAAPAPVAHVPQSSVRPSTTGSPNPTVRGHSYYENLKRTNFEEYLKPETEVQMMQDALKLGDEFFNK